MTDTRSKCRQS